MKFMKQFFIVLFVFAAGIIRAQTEPITKGNDGKSWTLETKSSIYQIGSSDQGGLVCIILEIKARIRQNFGILWERK